ncbi:major facilitator superfamily protein [Sphingomonas mucosissima]|uniref:Major facilitator superfamily protein n=2 Tax=Sphingomonas mucosissima TaxID=370959 RepID=A0A245ZIR8_9SPHN|nr:major facilitator superfamily protein [Sphingomonas mucosissima]
MAHLARTATLLMVEGKPTVARLHQKKRRRCTTDRRALHAGMGRRTSGALAMTQATATSTEPQGAGRRSWLFLLAYALAYAGGVIAYLPLLTLLLPLKVAQLAGPERIGLFSAIVIGGALAASISNVLFGWLSDRSVRRGGGRRRWMVIGLAGTCCSFLAVALASSAATIMAAIVLFQISVNALLGPLMAIMADEVPDTQKGVAGGLLSAAVPIASAVSAVLVGLVWAGEGLRLTILAAVVIAACLPLLLTPARMAPAAPLPAQGAAMPRRDLVTAWGARLLVQVAGNALSLYLLYYFQSIVPTTGAGELAPRVGNLLTIAYILSLPVALLAGRASDRLGRRKPVLLAGALFAAAGLLGMALANDWRWAAICFAVYAIGSAVFLALHAAFAMQLLPSPANRGRDLGLLNLANTLPALLGPLLTWALATPEDFGAVMMVLAFLTLAGGLAMIGVRSRS